MTFEIGEYLLHPFQIRMPLLHRRPLRTLQMNQTDAVIRESAPVPRTPLAPHTRPAHSFPRQQAP
jgi:hypothetical protein